MIMIERTKDWELVKRIVTDRSVYPRVSDDSSPCADCWQPIRDDAMYYLLAKRDVDILGLFAVSPENGICYKVHTCLLPHSYGEKATIAAKELIQWVFSNLQCERLITEVPEFNKLALKFAERSGMTRFGYNPKSYLKDGRLQGMTLLGISKEEVQCQLPQ
jgi:RimJ/RimL family protein N-acetyltransferase